MEFVARLKRVGGSLMVKIPEQVIKKEGIQKGGLVRIIKIEKLRL